MGILPDAFQSPIPSQTLKEDEYQDSDQSNINCYSSSSSSSSSSLLSQASLPSVPSLTPSLPSHRHHLHPFNDDATTLKGHSSYVFSVVLGGKYLHTGSSDGEIRRWSRYHTAADDKQEACHVVAEVQGGGVKSMVVLGDKLFTAHHDQKIRVWKIDDREDLLATAAVKYRCIATLPTLNERCTKLFSAKNYVEVRRHKKRTWVHHVDAVSALALSKDGEFLYSVSWDRSFKVWRTSDFKCLESVQNAHDDAINAIVVSNDGAYVYTGSADKKMKVWKKKVVPIKNEEEEEEEVEEEEIEIEIKRRRRRGSTSVHSLVATLEKHRSGVNALALSTDGSVLYSGACDRSIIVWDKEVEDGRTGDGRHMVVSGALRGHTKAILCLVVVSDLVVSGSADKTVRVWKRGTGKNYSCLGVFDGHRGPVKCLTAVPAPPPPPDADAATAVFSDFRDGCSQNSYLIYSGSLDFDVKIWKIRVPSPSPSPSTSTSSSHLHTT